MDHLASWPSMIFGITASGLPDCLACSMRIAFSLSTTAGGISSCETYSGFMAATCIGDLAREATKSGLRATKSVSQFTSTMTPMRLPCR